MVYLDEPAGPVEPGWISRPGKARVTYPNGNVFEGTFNEEKRKEGQGKYTWSSNAEGACCASHATHTVSDG